MWYIVCVTLKDAPVQNVKLEFNMTLEEAVKGAKASEVLVDDSVVQLTFEDEKDFLAFLAICSTEKFDIAEAHFSEALEENEVAVWHFGELAGTLPPAPKFQNAKGAKSETK